MIAIATAMPPLKKFRHFSLWPYTIVQDVVGEEPATIYSLKSVYRPFFKYLLQSLLKKHPNLIFSAEFSSRTNSVTPCFWARIREILPLFSQNNSLKIAVFCQPDEEALFLLLDAISPFSQTVSLVCEDTRFCEQIAQRAMESLGLIVNQRSVLKLHNPDLVLYLSGESDLSPLTKGYVINLSQKEISTPLPTLGEITNEDISTFLTRHPELQLNPSFLLTERMQVTRLIWKYSEKS